MPERVPVLIVGGGPVGLALAGDLGRLGVANLLAEARDGSLFQPKMDMVGIRSMEFCRRWGIVEDVESAGYNRAYVQDCAWVTNLNGFEFGRERFPAPQDEKPARQSPQHRERCPQNFFDPVLTRFAQRTGRSDIRYRTEFVCYTDQGDTVTATLRSAETGELFEVEADYLVGTDGAGSTVRAALGIEMSGEGTLTYTSNAIFRYADLEALHTKEPAYRYIFIGPEGTWATLVAINGRDEWRFSLIGDDQQSAVSKAAMRAAITRAVGREFNFELLSILPWTRRQLVADAYRKGRVFIAGDAAHLTSPTGGFGMNTGILDAVNLAWKLAARLQGWGGEELLDSYDFEQRPVAVRNITEAGDNLKRMLTPRLARPDPAMFDGDRPEQQSARREFGEQYTEMMKREWHSIGIHLGYVYEGSPVVVPDGSPMPTMEVSGYTQTARPGSRAPHVWLAPGRSILDEFGSGFVLLRFADAADSASLKCAAERVGIPLRVVDVDHGEAASIYENRLCLVRPDGQVAWRGDDPPADADALMRRVTGTRYLQASLGGHMPETRTYTDEPPESPSDSNAAEFVADTCRRLAEIILGNTGDSLRELAAREVRELLRILEQPDLIDPARVPAVPPRRTRSGGIYIDTNPVTSRRNPLAPPVSTRHQNGSAEMVTTLSLPYQGPRDRMHGGYAAVLLDHALWEAVRAHTRRVSLTRSLTITYKRAAPLRQELTVTGRVVQDDGRRTLAEGEIIASGEVCARAEGVWVTPQSRPAPAAEA